MDNNQGTPGYRVVTQPTRIPVPGDKLIEEYFGHVNTQTGEFSLAHMVAPPGWSEPAQSPEFAEITIMMRGRLRVELGDDTVDLAPGQAILTDPGQRVCYGNPFDAECEYWAVCIPAFNPDAAHRDEE